MTKLELYLLKCLKQYDDGVPIISDLEYDALIRRLKYETPDSEVLLKVGYAPTYGKKVEHKIPMGSLNKVTFDRDGEGNIKKDQYKGLKQLYDWIDSMGDYKIVWSYKVDGVSAELRYTNGVLTQASTRGNGIIGQDITDIIHNCPNIPKIIYSDSRLELGRTIIFRGELYISKKDFKAMVEDGRIKTNENTISNERNVCAGFVNSKDPSVCKDKCIKFIGWKVYTNDIEIKSMTKSNDFARKFNIPFVGIHDDVLDRTKIDQIDVDRHTMLDYRTDGLVFMVNDRDERESLGYVKYNPKGGVAFKFDTDKAWTIVTGVEWNTSRHGRVIPTAIVDSVILCDTIVGRVTANNYSFAKEMGISKDCSVLIEKRGDIIPYISSCTINSNKFEAPVVCPVCGGALDIDGVDLVCKNINCKGQLVGRLSWWLKSLGVDQIGEKVLETMLEASLLTRISDLYKLDVQDLKTLPRCSEMLANRYISNIKGKQVTFPLNFLVGLGIRGVGKSIWKNILDTFSFDEIFTLSPEQLMAVDGVGKAIAIKITEDLTKMQEEIQELLKYITVKTVPEVFEFLKDKSFCFTGTLSRSRSYYEQLVQDNGGSVKNSISKNVNYLVCGASSGNKLNKAEALGIQTISEEDFLKMF